MRFCYVLLICLLGLPALASPLPAAGVLLGPGGWEFRAGPDSAAGPAWQPLDPGQNLHALPAARRAGQGWWRYRLLVPAAWVGRPLALTLSQIGATEIYLDGRLLSRRGRLPGTPRRRANPLPQPRAGAGALRAGRAGAGAGALVIRV